jgi:hypothetical protein
MNTTLILAPITVEARHLRLGDVIGWQDSDAVGPQVVTYVGSAGGTTYYDVAAIEAGWEFRCVMGSRHAMCVRRPGHIAVPNTNPDDWGWSIRCQWCDFDPDVVGREFGPALCCDGALAYDFHISADAESYNPWDRAPDEAMPPSLPTVAALDERAEFSLELQRRAGLTDGRLHDRAVEAGLLDGDEPPIGQVVRGWVIPAEAGEASGGGAYGPGDVEVVAGWVRRRVDGAGEALDVATVRATIRLEAAGLPTLSRTDRIDLTADVCQHLGIPGPFATWAGAEAIGTASAPDSAISSYECGAATMRALLPLLLAALLGVLAAAGAAVLATDPTPGGEPVRPVCEVVAPHADERSGDESVLAGADYQPGGWWVRSDGEVIGWAAVEDDTVWSEAGCGAAERAAAAASTGQR